MMKVRAMTMNNKQNGAVSLFIVIFTTLLISIITVAFIRIMLSDQRQATASDLSQSAYDSAQAGVEDGKRALLDYQAECAKGQAECATAKALMGSTECNKALSKLIPGGYVANQEVMVKKNLADNNVLQQAYTCVKINLITDDYIGTLSKDGSKLVPLVGVSAFDTVQLEWFNAKDLSGSSTTIDGLSLASPSLLSQSNWTSAAMPNRPSIMRSQLMQFGTGFTLADFEDVNSSGQSNANTLFLYPSSILPGITNNFTENARKVASPGPVNIHCEGSLASGGYACKATLRLPTPIGGGDRTAYLRLTSLYKVAHYKVKLLNGITDVKFDGVEPSIDSTGRANDLFRRVQSRVEVVDTNFPYPDAAVDTTNTFCKNFLITDRASDYSNSCVTP